MLLFFMSTPDAGLTCPAFHKGGNGKSAYKNKEQREEEKQSEAEERQLAARHKCHQKK